MSSQPIPSFDDFVKNNPQQKPQAGSGAIPSFDDFSRDAASDPNVQNIAGGGSFTHNLVNSAGQFLANSASAAIHPISTATTLGKAVLGGLANATPGMENIHTPLLDASRETADAVGQNFKQRYGGLSNIAHAAYTDPVGTAVDASTILDPIGSMLGAAGDASKIGALSKAGDVISTAADFTNPARLPGAAAKQIVKRIPKVQEMASGLYQSALKPSTTLTDAERVAIIRTGLQEGIPVSRAGLDAASSRIDSLGKDIEAKIQAAAQQGVTIDPQSVADRVNEVRSRFANQVRPQSDLATLNNAGKEFMAEHTPQSSSLLGPNGEPLPPPTPIQIPIDRAQSLKQGTYQQLRRKGAYGEMSSADVEADKALARGLKEEIVKQVPELAGLNARDSALINLEGSLQKAVGRIGNHNPLNPTGVVTGAATGMVTGNTPLAIGAGLLKHVINDPAVRSRLAIALSKAQFSGVPGSKFLPGAGTVRTGAAVRAAAPPPVIPSPQDSGPAYPGQ